MDHIPGLDILNVSGGGHQHPYIFDEFFPTPVNIGNMRSEEDFKCRCVYNLKAPITLCKGTDDQNSKDISLVIHKETQDTDDELKDILQELEIISDIDHNNVLKFYETIAASKLTDVAFVFEPIGGLLSEIITQKIENLYQPSVIKAIMRDLYTGLNYLHRNHIIHRDIQPENIVFTSTGILKIWNFRNARRVGQKLSKKLKVNEFRYQSIELLMETEKYDESVDIWSANCIFAQLWLRKTFCPEHGREKVLEGIFLLLGFPKKDIWEEFFSFPGVNDLGHFTVAKFNRIDSYFKKHCDCMVSTNAMDLIHRCFRYNPKYRPKAEYCLLHPYFLEEPRACYGEEIVTILNHSAICDQLRAMKDKKSV